MVVYVLVSGLLRTFTDSLFPFLCELAEKTQIELLLCTTNDTNDTKFNGKSVEQQLQHVLQKPFAKLCSINNMDITTKGFEAFNQRERNTIYQWYHIYSCFQALKDKSLNPADIVIRIRPDVRFSCSVDDLLVVIKQAQSHEGILIPLGNDIFHSDYRKYTRCPVNDQIAIAQYKYMSIYGDLYASVNYTTLLRPIISEQILSDYLQSKQIHVYRVYLPYTLCLSECCMIAVTGDSGVGKSTLTEALRIVFPFDKNIILETDRYHKWERSNTMWKQFTHLNPEANYLEKLADDTYLLKLGEQVQQVDYDHRTGTFTDIQEIESKPYVFLCGLHTLYKEDMRSNYDLTFFIHTEYSLKRFWKIQRDMKKRGYTFDRCVEIFQSRQADYDKFILPQITHADIVIYYRAISVLPDVFTLQTPNPDICMSIGIRRTIPGICKQFLSSIAKSTERADTEDIYMISEQLSVLDIYTNIPREFYKYIKLDTLKCGYLGVLQALSILILMNPASEV
jgi:uridine kinase